AQRRGCRRAGAPLPAAGRLSSAPRPQHRHAAPARGAGGREPAGRGDRGLPPRRFRLRPRDARGPRPRRPSPAPPLPPRPAPPAPPPRALPAPPLLGPPPAVPVRRPGRPPLRLGPALPAARGARPRLSDLGDRP